MLTANRGTHDDLKTGGRKTMYWVFSINLYTKVERNKTSEDEIVVAKKIKKVRYNRRCSEIEMRET